MIFIHCKGRGIGGSAGCMVAVLVCEKYSDFEDPLHPECFGCSEWRNQLKEDEEQIPEKPKLRRRK